MRADGLAGGGGVGGELVELRDLRGSEGAAGGRRVCAARGYRMRDAEVSRCLRRLSRPRTASTRPLERLRDVDGALADAVGCLAVGLLGERDAEGFFKLIAGAGELEGAGVELRGRGFDGEAELLGEGP